MSTETALNKAIYGRLAGTEALTGEAADAQAALAALLGTDPDTERPAVHMGNKSAVVVYPALTFRPSGGLRHGMSHEDLGGIEEQLYDLELWENTGKGDTITDLYDLVDQLLCSERNVAPVLPLEAGRVFDMQAVTRLQVLYDDKSNAWFGLARYRYLVAHY